MPRPRSAVLQYRSSYKAGPRETDFASRTSFYHVSDLLFRFRRSPFLLEFSILFGPKIKEVECMLRRLEIPAHFRASGEGGNVILRNIVIRGVITATVRGQ